MTLWDGLTTGNDTRILVLGATNRPNDIDSAILRRMPKRFSIKLPDAGQRRNILGLVRFEFFVRVIHRTTLTVKSEKHRCSKISTWILNSTWKNLLGELMDYREVI